MPYNFAGKFLKYCWLVALAATAILNIQPYLSLTRGLSQNVGAVPFLEIFSSLPVVGPVLGLAAIAIPDVVTVAIFLLIQGLQCLPMLLANPSVVRARIEAGEQWQQLPIHDADPKWLVGLKQRLNNFPLEWIQRIHNASKVAYAIDFLLAGATYPLFKGGWLAAIQGWAVLDLGSVLWANVPEFLIMIFAMEAAIWLFLKLSEGIDIFNAPAQPQPGTSDW